MSKCCCCCCCCCCYSVVAAAAATLSLLLLLMLLLLLRNAGSQGSLTEQQQPGQLHFRSADCYVCCLSPYHTKAHWRQVSLTSRQKVQSTSKPVRHVQRKFVAAAAAAAAAVAGMRHQTHRQSSEVPLSSKKGLQAAARSVRRLHTYINTAAVCVWHGTWTSRQWIDDARST